MSKHYLSHTHQNNNEQFLNHSEKIEDNLSSRMTFLFSFHFTVALLWVLLIVFRQKLLNSMSVQVWNQHFCYQLFMFFGKWLCNNAGISQGFCFHNAAAMVYHLFEIFKIQYFVNKTALHPQVFNIKMHFCNHFLPVKVYNKTMLVKWLLILNWRRSSIHGGKEHPSFLFALWLNSLIHTYSTHPCLRLFRPSERNRVKGG